jgi:hypothetical protein
VAAKCSTAKPTQSSRRHGRRQAQRSASASKDLQTSEFVPVREWRLEAFEALLCIVQDAAADPEVRRKAALKITEFLLPKVPKKAKILADEYGLRVRSKHVREYRNMRFRLRTLVDSPKRKIPEIAEKIKELEERSAAIRRQLDVPCPARYGYDEVVEDLAKLMKFSRLRDDRKALTETQQAEEAHVKLRYDLFATSPESIARRRLKVLEDAEQLFRKGRFLRFFSAKPLSRVERHGLALLRRLYSQPKPKRKIKDDAAFLEIFDYHPFRDELPSSNGYFYPPHSKVRPKGVFTITGVNGPPTAPDHFYDSCPIDLIPSGAPL